MENNERYQAIMEAVDNCNDSNMTETLGTIIGQLMTISIDQELRIMELERKRNKQPLRANNI